MKAEQQIKEKKEELIKKKLEIIQNYKDEIGKDEEEAMYWANAMVHVDIELSLLDWVLS